MANNLEFKISAEDQASRVVETVQHKINNFGKDVAKMAIGFAGPLALVQMGMQAIGDYMEKQKEKQKKIQDELNASADKETQEHLHRYDQRKNVIDDEIASIQARANAAKKAAEEEENRPEKMVSSVDKFLRYTEEGKNLVEQERKKIEEENRKISEEFRKNLKFNISSGSSSSMFDAGVAIGQPDYKTFNFDDAIENLSKQKDIQERVFEINNRINGLADIEENNRLKKLQDEKELLELEKEKLVINKTKFDFEQRILKSAQALRDVKLKEQEIQKLTVSSLREIGGGLAGESSAIAGQINMSKSNLGEILNAQQWNDAAKEMKEVAVIQKATFTDFNKMIQDIPQILQSPYSEGFINPGIDTTK